MGLTATRFFDLPETSLDPQVEADFYNALKMRNGTFKTTRRRRFDDINPDLAAFAKKFLPAAPSVLDVAVSAGVSTAELADALRGEGMTPKITATDLFLKAWLLHFGRGLRVLVDRRGWPLQYDIADRAIRPWTRRLDYLTFAFLPRAAARNLLSGKLQYLAEREAGKPVMLISRRLANDASVQLVEDDVLARRADFVGKFDLVRAANILNLNYFEESQLETAIANLKSYLKGPGSTLLVTRTMEREGRNAGTLFRLEPSGHLTAAHRYGSGSEIEDLVLKSAGTLTSASR